MFEKLLQKLAGLKIVEKMVNYSHTTIGTAYATAALVWH
jgi:hypothetical protein